MSSAIQRALDYKALPDLPQIDERLISVSQANPTILLVERLDYVKALTSTCKKRLIADIVRSLSTEVDIMFPPDSLELSIVEHHLCTFLKEAVNIQTVKGRICYLPDMSPNLQCIMDTVRERGDDKPLKKMWTPSLHSGIDSRVADCDWKNAATALLYHSKIYCITFTVSSVSGENMQIGDMDYRRDNVAVRTKQFLEVTLEQKKNSNFTTAVFEKFLGNVALVLMSCTMEVQLGALLVLRCGQDQQPLFLETLFRTYMNALTWLRVRFGIQKLTEAFWCFGNRKENGKRYDMLVVTHDWFQKLHTSSKVKLKVSPDYLSGGNHGKNSAFADSDVIEYLDYLATFCFDCTWKLPQNVAVVPKSDDICTRFSQQAEATVRNTQKQQAAAETVSLFKMSPTAKDLCHCDHLRSWSTDKLHADKDVFAVDLKTRFRSDGEALPSFLLDMADAHSFKNVTLLFYLRTADLDKLFFDQTGLWFLQTNAWNLGAMLAAKHETTVNVPGGPPQSLRMATEVVHQRGFIVFDDGVFRTFTNDVYKLSAPMTGLFEPEDKLKTLLSKVLNKHRLKN